MEGDREEKDEYETGSSRDAHDDREDEDATAERAREREEQTISGYRSEHVLKYSILGYYSFSSRASCLPS